MKSRKFLFLSAYGLPFIIPTLILGLLMVVLIVISYKPVLLYLGLLFTFSAIFFIWFFRDPERVSSETENVVISPADGRVVEISRDLSEINDERLKDFNKLAIFMSVFDVHVNRMPLDGKLLDIKYSKGRFYPADRQDASKNNENNLLIFENTNGKYKFALKQIAGLIAKRIVSWVEKGESVRMGQRFGIILFGSRVEIFLPKEFDFSVNIGERVKAGKTVIGRRN